MITEPQVADERALVEQIEKWLTAEPGAIFRDPHDGSVVFRISDPDYLLKFRAWRKRNAALTPPG
jgi:hypothetical protein